MDATSEHELVERCREGDEQAFRGLFRRYAPTAQALARRIVRYPALAEEIVQEVFLSVWRSPATHDPARGSVRSWLMGMVHHRSVDAVRREEAQRRRAAEAIPDVIDLSDDPGVTVPEEIGLPEERKVVRHALEKLPPEQRQVIELAYFEGLSQSEIAARTGDPLGTVKGRVRSAMEKLAGLLGGRESRGGL